MSSDERPDSLLQRATDDRTLLAVLGITVVALAARLAFLGSRVAHWDEGRVGYWILRYMQTDHWSYRPIVHGPFFVQVNSVVFSLLGVSDFNARLVVAVVGGLLPLSAWLFREHLRKSELVALALLFTANPILLYYSRFMRNDLLLAAFMIFTIGFVVRLFDTRKVRYLYLASLTLGLAFTTKENVLIYLLVWAGAGVLLLDHRLFRATADTRERSNESDDEPPSAVQVMMNGGRAWTGRHYWSAWLSRWGLHVVLALVELLVVVVFFYAPRPEFNQAFTQPGLWPTVVNDATLGAWDKFASTWASGQHQSHQYLPYFEHYVKVLKAGAAPLAILAVVGFVADRYSGRGPRDIVSFAFYWGFVSIFGYPLITDIQAPWAPIHAVAPLAIPAAVGGALLYRWGRDAARDDDLLSAALAALIVLAVVGQVTMVAVNTTYVHPQDRYLNTDTKQTNMLVQYGQPAAGLRPILDNVSAAIQGHNGTQVLYYGSDFYVSNESQNLDPPAGSKWYQRLPLPWYMEMDGANVSSTKKLKAFKKEVKRDHPPVVIARAKNASDLAPYLQGYTKYENDLTLWGSKTVFFVDRSQISNATAE